MNRPSHPDAFWIDPDQVVAQLPTALVVFDLRDRASLVNEAAAAMLRLPQEEILNRSIDDLVASPTNVGKNSATLMHGGTFRSRPMVWNGGEGSLVEVLASASLVRDDLGCPVGTLYVLEPVSDPERADPIRYQALHDPMTGLPNRIPLVTHLRDLLDDRDRTGRAPGLLYVDLDHFSRINDSLGHEAGDTVLREVARRLKHELRGEDLVARYGGDVFAVSLDLATPEDATRVADKLLAALRRPFAYEGRELGLTASIGIATCPPDGETPSVLVQRATGAVHEAKRLGSDRWALADDSVQAEIRSRFEIESRLRSAIRGNRLELHHQPIVGFDGRLLGSETLLRWPDEEEIPIDDVIGVAESSGLISELGQWVRERVCSEVDSLKDLSPDYMLSCNISPRELEDADFAARVGDLLDRANIPAERIQLEITETALMTHPQRVLRTLTELRKRGIRLAVDDFGAGHASLGYVRNLPIDLLKIDRSLVRDIGTLNGDALVRSILTLAEVLGLEVVAEGVETEQQRDFLVEHGCQSLQGYLFGRPMPTEAFRAWAADRTQTPGTDGPSPAPAETARR